MPNVGAVVIGRNEGDRLKRCLKSLLAKVGTTIYVDSGSTDGSTEMARTLGCEIVQLDSSVAFTAARARNAGFQRLLQVLPNARFVQFVDGDCEVCGGWLTHAVASLKSDGLLAVVCGRRRERFPDASVYNRLCDIEWNTPIGPAKSCGGDAMFRVSAFQEIGGYNPDIIAGEEPELCVRLRAAGWKVMRLNEEMTLHDAAITHFSQWWKRTVRSGHAYAEGYARHGQPPERFNVRQVRSILVWGALDPLLIIASLALSYWHARLAIVAVVLLLGYIALSLRVYRGQRRRGLGPRHAALYAAFVMLGKIPQSIGSMKYALNYKLGRSTALIEYKNAVRKNAASQSLSPAGGTQDAA
ncbi:MAG: glycosyltransferase [Planctomycetota bacterium]|nr:glycosyltransferase [Planctomycetota bacterium]